MRSGLFGIEALVREPARTVDRRAAWILARADRHRHATVAERKAGDGPADARRRPSRDEQPR